MVRDLGFRMVMPTAGLCESTIVLAHASVFLYASYMVVSIPFRFASCVLSRYGHRTPCIQLDFRHERCSLQ